MMSWQEAARIAEDWQAKGNPGWELNGRRSAIGDALREAVQMSEAQGVASLRDPALLAQAERLVAIAVEHQRAEDNDDALDLALIAGNRALALALIAHARSMEGGPTNIMQYWREYRRAIVALLARQPFQALPNTPKAPGWLATFVPNLALAEALSTGADTGPAIAAVDVAFAKRQRDKRMFDPGGHDGDGQVPVLWNVRKAALLAAAALAAGS